MLVWMLSVAFVGVMVFVFVDVFKKKKISKLFIDVMREIHPYIQFKLLLTNAPPLLLIYNSYKNIEM